MSLAAGSGVVAAYAPGSGSHSEFGRKVVTRGGTVSVRAGSATRACGSCFRCSVCDLHCAIEAWCEFGCSRMSCSEFE